MIEEDDEKWLEMTVPGRDEESQQLIPSVRREYFNYLKKVIAKNYYYSGEIPKYLILAAHVLELEVTAQSLVLPLYRSKMTSLINRIKEHTAQKKISPMVHHSNIRKRVQNASAQSNLDVVKSTKDSSTQVEPEDEIKTDDNDLDDEVTRRLNEIFNNADEDMFGDLAIDINELSSPIEANNIKQEIEDFQATETEVNSDTLMDFKMEHVKDEEVKIKVEPEQPKYVYTKWPCELHFQKKRLCETLVKICDKDYRKFSKVKHRFIELFGEDSDDELEPVFPIYTKDFLRSCRYRICPIVVHHMKPFFKHYKLSSTLFKPMVYKILYRITEKCQYPSDYEVFQFVRTYFKSHYFMKDIPQLKKC